LRNGQGDDLICSLEFRDRRPFDKADTQLPASCREALEERIRVQVTLLAKVEATRSAGDMLGTRHSFHLN
jgi:hypothetical protein